MFSSLQAKLGNLDMLPKALSFPLNHLQSSFRGLITFFASFYFLLRSQAYLNFPQASEPRSLPI